MLARTATGLGYKRLIDYEFPEGRIYVQRSEGEKQRITERLNKIEGQVRGVRQMVENERYCLDEVQQVNAIVAAMRKVELMIIDDHLNAGMEFAVKSQNIDAAVKDMMVVLSAALRR